MAPTELMANHFYESFTDGDTLYRFGCTPLAFESGEGDSDSVRVELYLNLPSSGYFHFNVSWMSHPDHTTAGHVIECDDLDLYVRQDGGTPKYSTSWDNTTEYLYHSHSSGTRRYEITLFLYDRVSDTDTDIFAGISWYPTSSL